MKVEIRKYAQAWFEIFYYCECPECRTLIELNISGKWNGDKQAYCNDCDTHFIAKEPQ